jgi:ABC-type phosphate/phosphonate transport system substrate-binding protein
VIVRASVCLFLALGLGLAPSGGAAEPAAAPAAPNKIKVGIMDGMFRGVPEGLVQAGGQQFGGLFKTITGLPGEVESEKGHLALAKKITNNQTHLGVFHGFEWAWIQKQNPDLAPLAITVPSQLPQAAILVNAKAAFNKPEDLKGESLEIPFNMKAHGFVYAEKLAKDAGAVAFKINPTDDQSMDELIDDLNKNRVKSVLVDAGAFSAWQKNNPGKAPKVKVLCQSIPMPQTVVVYNKKHLPENIVKQLQEGLLGADKNPQGKAFLFLWNLRGFELPNAGFDKLVGEALVAFPAPEKK